MNQLDLLRRRVRPGYNCAHFLCEAWLAETGVDITPAMAGFLTAQPERNADIGLHNAFARTLTPVSPCVALFRRGRATPHVGLFVRDRVFHLTKTGAARQSLAIAQMGYTSVRFYAYR